MIKHGSIHISREGRGIVMKNDRDVEKMVAQMDLKRGPRREVVQYGKGLLAGMHMAYCAVARKLHAEGRREDEVRNLLGGLVGEEELRSILKEAGY